ncbi:hypothetical protein PQ456_05090 [Paenibacillus kyungheensis]|uniref:HipA-like kinase domain-containing protein n=1 Tax=Paenibacillus kyungheensis TaxID=1452732 RepID=A0AAX3M4T9_9BACL|nr:HipA family kinase [Paenibacillus kyungheensis]WCT56902.1 hypothetical protein PQ456_05090 [Paenibacillus kyungheensis]
MDTLKANRIMNPIKNGSTLPYYINCEDGQTYAVKFKENPQGIKAIVNEYICSELALLLQLPIPKPVLIHLTEEFCSMYGQKLKEHIGSDILPGVHFGCLKLKKAYPIELGSMLNEAINIEIIAELLIFDLFICNSDRDNNGGNLLFDPQQKKIIILDHTHAFDLGTIWEASQLNQRIGEPFTLLNLNGHVYRKLVPYVKGYNPFNSILEKLKTMTTDQIWNIINSVPNEWLLSPDDKLSLNNYLCDRKERIEETLPLLKNNLPSWKGGL